jgi:hypothetical protein
MCDTDADSTTAECDKCVTLMQAVTLLGECGPREILELTFACGAFQWGGGQSEGSGAQRGGYPPLFLQLARNNLPPLIPRLTPAQVLFGFVCMC